MQFLNFFLRTSGQILLEKHWILLKTVPIAFPVNVSKLISKKDLNFSLFLLLLLLLLLFFSSAYGKFVNISMEPFIKVFLVFQFSLLYHGDLYLHGFMKFNEYTETVNCLSLNNSMILKIED